jgi:hypothetical protein
MADEPNTITSGRSIDGSTEKNSDFAPVTSAVNRIRPRPGSWTARQKFPSSR